MEHLEKRIDNVEVEVKEVRGSVSQIAEALNYFKTKSQHDEEWRKSINEDIHKISSSMERMSSILDKLSEAKDIGVKAHSRIDKFEHAFTELQMKQIEREANGCTALKRNNELHKEKYNEDKEELKEALKSLSADIKAIKEDILKMKGRVNILWAVGGILMAVVMAFLNKLSGGLANLIFYK